MSKQVKHHLENKEKLCADHFMVQQQAANNNHESDGTPQKTNGT